MKRWIVFGSFGCVLLAGLTLFDALGYASPTTLSVSNLTSIATGLAAKNGVPYPTNVRYVTSTRQAANRLLAGAQVDSDEAVTVFEMDGSFVGQGASVPRGAKLPTGSALTVVIDDSTGRILDWGIPPQGVDLTPLGAVTTVSPPVSQSPPVSP